MKSRKFVSVQEVLAFKIRAKLSKKGTDASQAKCALSSRVPEQGLSPFCEASPERFCEASPERRRVCPFSCLHSAKSPDFMGCFGPERVRKFFDRLLHAPAWRHYAVLGIACALLLTACQTGSKSKSDEGPPPAMIVEFKPSTRSTTLRLREGRYPNLFTANTVATWVSEEPISPAVKGGAVPPLSGKATMLAANPGLIVLQCTMESAFSDMSIAYDVVGFRGLSVYLQTPDGRTVIPAQTMVGSDLKEARRGALKVFQRTNLLVFSRQEAALMVPVLNAEGASTRIVLEGLESTFYFEWFPLISESVKLSAEKYLQEKARNDKRKKKVISKKLKGWIQKFN